MPSPKDIIPPRNRGYLIDSKNSGARTEITEDVINWNDLSFKHERDGFSGVFVSVSQAIEVCRRGKILIREAFRNAMLGMSMTFQIVRRGPKNFVYERVHSMRLDPGTYEERKDYVSIEGQALTFDALVKSVGKTKYDLPITATDDDLGLSTVDWQYKHNQMVVRGNYTIPEVMIDGEGPEGATTFAATFFSNINLDAAEMVLNGIGNDFRSQEYQLNRNFSTTLPNPDDKYFFRAAWLKEDNAVPTQTVRLIIDFDYTAIGLRITDLGSTIFNFVLERYNDESATPILSIPLTRDPGTTSADYVGTIYIDQNVTLDDGDKLRCYLQYQNNSGLASVLVSFTTTKIRLFRITYVDKTQLTDTIPAITPLTLANKLLDKMSGKDPLKKYTAEIDADTDNPWTFDHYLVSAESIRGFSDANFHASFNDFLEYMQFLGYEYETDEDALVVHFRKRAYFFNPSITAMQLRDGEVANVVIKGDDEYAYSTVRVGYEKPDIENTNGRFAMCGAFDYSTDYSNSGTLKDSTLEIMCPYKADPVLIETLSWTRGEKTTDQKDDNDIFMLAAVTVGDHIEESRAGQYMVADADLATSIGWYNLPYIPYFIAQRNAGKIGVAVRNLTFTATETYRDATLSGAVTVDPYSNIAIPEGLFLPMIYEFDAGTQQGLPPAMLRAGLVRFVWNGQPYQGYIKELVEHAVNSQGESWVLRAR